jgi:hypothetical protein
MEFDVKKAIDVAGVVTAAIKEASRERSNDLAPKDAAAVAKDVAPKVEAGIAKQVNAVVANATNAEPWYQSRVVLGALVSGVAVVLGVAGYQLDAVDQESIVAFALAAAALAGNAYTLYGRLVARFKKPLGE